MKKADMICALTGMTLGAGAFIMTFSFKKFKNVPVGPEFFPRVLSLGLFICCAVLLVQSLVGAARQEQPPQEQNPEMESQKKRFLRLFIGLGIIVLYAICWELIGFLLVSPPTLFGLMFLMGMRAYPRMILFSLGTVAVVYGAFKFFLGIDMPMGILESVLY